MWEERQLERERQREKLDKEYVNKLYLNRTMLKKEQAAATYDANVKTETVGWRFTVWLMEGVMPGLTIKAPNDRGAAV